jgi:hypothetical protein
MQWHGFGAWVTGSVGFSSSDWYLCLILLDGRIGYVAAGLDLV